MRIDLVVYDAHGKTRGYTRLRLEFGQDLWSVEEDAQRAWRNAGFSSSGPFETMDDDVIWLWEQEIGNVRHNTVVLTGIALDEPDAEQSGTGRIVTGQVGKLLGGSVFWAIAEPAHAAAPTATIELLPGRDTPARMPTELAA
jgi:hypothetical protein